MEGQHAVHEVFEAVTEEASGHASLMSLPEEVTAIASDELIVRVIFSSSLEGLCPRVEDENNDAEGEQIYELALITRFKMKFRCHIAACTKLRRIPAATIISLDACSEAKIDNLNVVVFVNEDVLQLEISVSKINHVHRMNCEEKLPY